MTVQDFIDQLSKLDRNVEVVVAIPYWLPVDTEIPVQRLWVDGASPRKLMIEMETGSPPWDKPKPKG